MLVSNATDWSDVGRFKKWLKAKWARMWPFWKPVAPGLATLILFFGFISVTSPERGRPDTKPIGVFNADVASQKVKSVQINDDGKLATITLKNGRKYQVAYPSEYGDDMVNRLTEAQVPVTVSGKGFAERYQLMLTILAICIVLMVLMLVFRRNPDIFRGAASLRSSGVEITPAEIPKVKFSDVGGAEELVREFARSVKALKKPESCRRFGVTPLTGYLLYGEPGTGKTLFARAIAGEAGVPFFAMKGSDFMGRYLNDGPRAVKEFFAQARRHKAWIIFIDEIDSIASRRSSNDDSGSKELNNTLNELLAQLDGFAASEDSVGLVIGATNRPDDLDPGIKRPGRLTRHAVMPTPDPKARRAILAMHANRLGEVADDVDYDQLAKLTSGMTGAQLAEVVNEAGRLAIEENEESPRAVMHHFMEALETTEMGIANKSREINKRDRDITAIHESGHALLAWLVKDAEAPTRISIIPRGGSGGHTRMETGDWLFLTTGQMKARLVTAMGGRAAEKLILDDFTTGAAHDIALATDLATHMVCEVAMGEKFTARIRLNSGHDPRQTEVTAEIDKLVKSAEEEASRILIAHQDKLEALRDHLLEVETLSGDELQAWHDAVMA